MVADDFKTQAKTRFEGKSSEELIRIAFFAGEEYREDAIELAREILANRGINSPDHDEVVLERSVALREEARAPTKGKEPLSSSIKAVCLVLPLVGVVIGSTKRLAGNKRASREAWVAAGIGFVAQFIIGRLLSLVV